MAVRVPEGLPVALDGSKHDALSPRDLVRAASVLRERGYFRVPLALYDAALRVVESEEARVGKGICQGKLGHFVAARETLAPLFLAAVVPQRREAYWAYVLERTGAMREALAWYDAALAGVDGADPWTNGHRAYCLEKASADEEARSAYESVLTAHPGDTWARKRFALFLFRRGDRAAMRRILDEGRSLQSNAALAQIGALEVALVTGDLATARADLTRLREQPDLTEAHRVVVDVIAWAGGARLSEPTGELEFHRLQTRIEELDVSVHRDFEDLERVVEAGRGDLGRFLALTSALVK